LLTLPDGDFYLQYLQVTSNAHVDVAPGALVRLFVEGEVEVDASSVLNAPLGGGSTLYIVSRAASTCRERISIASREGGVLYVYAPRVEVDVDNRAGLYGGIVGLEVNLQNVGTLYGLNIPPGPPQLVCPAQSYGVPPGGKPRACPSPNHRCEKR